MDTRCSKSLAFLIVALGFLLPLLNAAYNTNSTIVPGKLNVHLVAHSHDDLGWLQTVEGYYETKVSKILSSVVQHLKANPDRKFVQTEQAFFHIWWNKQSEAVKNDVQQLVKSGQLDFVNGGWCMHDEAATHYVDMIDQTTLGHLFLKQRFDKVPRIGWQIDPFGHSAVQGYLLGTEVGFDGIFFARIDYQDRAQRKANKSLEFIWEGSKTLKSDNQIYAGAFPFHYNPPKTFHYENPDAIFIQDDRSKGARNVDERVRSFVQAAHEYANITRTNHVMWLMGDDFTYTDASVWYNEMDKLIHYVNKDGEVNVLYSTPAIYLDAKHAADSAWPIKKIDFFPYADSGTSYWTGYFSSRPAFKGYVRSLSGLLQASRQLEVLAGKRSQGAPSTENLWSTLAVVQHHDAVSGTAQQHVTNDYAKQLAAVGSEAEKVMASAVSCLANGNSISECRGKQVSSDLVQCPLLNISFCATSEETLAANKILVVTAYNSLGWTREDYVEIPVPFKDVIVVDAAGKVVPSQLAPISDATKRIRNLHVQAYLGIKPADRPLYTLVFKAQVPPLGFNSYSVKRSKPNESGSAVNSEIGIADKVQGTNLSQSYYWYTGYSGEQSSGAYIFRPADRKPTKLIPSKPAVSVNGPVYTAVRQEIAPWIYQEERVYKDKEHTQIEFLVGPIPVNDRLGKEVITRFKAGIASNKKFYTDSNGRDFLERVRDERSDWDFKIVQPVAGNYYPVNLGIYLRDNRTDLSVLVDRAMGGSSLADGEIELMLHRRLLHDDGRGVSEPLNEEVCVDRNCEGLAVRGMLYYRTSSPEQAAAWRRQQGQKILSPLQLFFGSKAEKTKLQSFSIVERSYSLPDNVALITLQELENNTILARLAHIFEVDEDEKLSKPATVDLRKLFWTWEITKLTELSLSANQAKSSMKRLRWKTEGKTESGAKRGAPIDPKTLVMELGPMEIRTLLLVVKLRL